MKRLSPPRALRALALAPLLALGGCDWVVMNPAGDVARQQADLILWSTGLMLLIIVPVIILTLVFAWRYRASNEEASYTPDWDHSTSLELIIWAAPLMIIIALGALTWVATHTLDPYRPLSRTAPGRPLPGNQRPLQIQVVSLDWKWLFIYPEQGIATVNALVLPQNRPVQFRMTSSSVMNTFWVPSMAGMIYTMPGMETRLHAVLNKTGRFEGRSGNYSGAGFSGMTFWTYSVPDAGFNRWVQQMRAGGGQLDANEYLRLEKPSENVPPRHYAAVQQDLFSRAVNMCVRTNQPCMGAVMAADKAEPGSHPPVNDRAAPQGAKGALQRAPEEKGTSPHEFEPTRPAPGSTAPGAEANRNMSSADRPVLPGSARAARA